MADKNNATVLRDGQLAIATVGVNGTLVSGASDIDTTALVQTDDGEQLCVKTFPLDGGGGGGGTSDYTDLSNKPQINGVTLSGNKSSSDLGVADTSLSNLTDNGNIKIAEDAMPGEYYDQLTISTSGQEYTAPADGYFYLHVDYMSSNTNWASLVGKKSSDSANLVQSSIIGGAQCSYGIFIPCKKGHKCMLLFNAPAFNDQGGVNKYTYLRFIYAVGSESEYVPQP